jgi:Associated with zinc fingers.
MAKKKKPTSTFFVNLEQKENNKEVYGMKYIYHTKAIIEPPKKKTGLVQCMRCQQYGHTKNNCMRPWRCVKCASNHKTTDCPKTDRNTPATCALFFLKNTPPTLKDALSTWKSLREKPRNVKPPRHQPTLEPTQNFLTTKSTTSIGTSLKHTTRRTYIRPGEPGPTPLNTATWTKQARSHIRKTIPSN